MVDNRATDMGRFFSHISRLARLLLLLSGMLLLLAGAALWQLSRELPAPACRWLERRLSQGRVSFAFREASVGLWQGIRLRDVRVHPKRSLGAPLLHADEIRLTGTLRFNRQPAEWIDEITFRGLQVGTYQEWPTPMAGRPLLAWAVLFDPAQPYGALFARPVRIVVEDARIHGVAAERVVFMLRSRKNRLLVEEARVDFQTARFRERLDGDLAFDFTERRLQARAAGTLTPDVVEELCLSLDGANAVKVMHLFGEPVAPMSVNGSLLVELLDPGEGTWLYDMRMAVQSPAIPFRGLPLDSLSLTLQWYRHGQERKLTVAPIRVAAGGGEVEMALAYHPARHLTDFTLQSTLSATNLLAATGIVAPPLATNLLFAAPPVLAVAGTWAGTEARQETTLRGRATCEALAARGCSFTNARAEFYVAGSNRVEVSRLSADSYGGSLTGRVAFVRDGAATAPRVDLQLAVRQVDVASALADNHVASEMGGRLDGRLQLAFPWQPEPQVGMVGEGHFNIREGTLLRIQLFAGLTDFLGRNVPGVDALLMQSNASLPFTVTNGMVRVEAFRVEGNLFSLTANGRCRLVPPDYPVEGVAQMRFFKQKTVAGMLARLVTLPISKMMEFRVTGPATHPHWNYIGLIDRLMGTIRGDASDDGGDGHRPENERP